MTVKTTPLIAIIIFFTGASSILGQTVSEAEFVPIFDGRSLDGWHLQKTRPDERYVATSENFYVNDGALHCYQLENQDGSLLLMDATYGDFEVQMEVKSD